MFPKQISRNSFVICCRLGLLFTAICCTAGLWVLLDGYQVRAAAEPVGLGAGVPGEIAEVVAEPITAITLNGPDTGDVSAVYTFTVEIEPVQVSEPITYTWEATDQETLINIGGASDTVTFSWESRGSKTISVTASNEISSLTAVQTIAISGTGVLYFPGLQRACEPFFWDDFSNPGSGWPVADTATLLLEYNNGEYRTLVKNRDWLVAINSGVMVDPMSKLEIDLRNASGIFGSYGLMFGLAPDFSETYVLEIYPDSWYGLWYYHENTGWSLLQEGSSEFINPGSASNHLMISFAGSAAQFFINSHYVTVLPYVPISGKNYSGLIVFSYDSGNVDVRFDNYRLETTACGEQIAQNRQPLVLPNSEKPDFIEGKR